MTQFDHDMLATNVLPAKLVHDMFSAAGDMSREKLVECIRWLALSHERLRADFEGVEGMYNAITSGDRQ